MGWAVGYDSNWRRDIGYGVPAQCDQPECTEEIDRGLGYVCGGEPYGGEHGCGLTDVSDEYGPDFVPTPAQEANADQNLAAVRNSVNALIDKVLLGQLDRSRPLSVAVSLLAADEVDRLAGDSEDLLSPALAMVGVAVVRLAAGIVRSGS